MNSYRTKYCLGTILGLKPCALSPHHHFRLFRNMRFCMPHVMLLNRTSHMPAEREGLVPLCRCFRVGYCNILPHYEHIRTTRRCRPKVTRIGTHGLLHSRCAMPWRLTRSSTSSRWSRVPNSRLAESSHLKILKLRGNDFEML